MASISDMSPENAKKALLSLYTDLPAKSKEGTRGAVQAAKSHNVFLVFAKVGEEAEPKLHYVEKDLWSGLQRKKSGDLENFVVNAKKLKELCAKVNQKPDCIQPDERAELKKLEEIHNEMVDKLLSNKFARHLPRLIRGMFAKDIEPSDLKISFSLKKIQNEPIATPAAVIRGAAARVLPPLQQVTKTEQLDELQKLEGELTRKLEEYGRVELKDSASELEKSFHEKRGQALEKLARSFADIREKREAGNDVRDELDSLKKIGIGDIRVQLPSHIKAIIKRIEDSKAGVEKSLASIPEAERQKSPLNEKCELLAAELEGLKKKDFPKQIALAVEIWATDCVEDDADTLEGILDDYDKATKHLSDAIALYPDLGMAIDAADQYLRTQREAAGLKKEHKRLQEISIKLLENPLLKEGQRDAIKRELNVLKAKFNKAH